MTAKRSDHPDDQSTTQEVQQKESSFRWIPVVVTALIAVGSNAMLMAYSAGKIEQRIVPLEEHAKIFNFERAVEKFVTRSEFTTRTQQRDREMMEVKSALDRANAKLDRLLERNTRD